MLSLNQSPIGVTPPGTPQGHFSGLRVRSTHAGMLHMDETPSPLKTDGPYVEYCRFVTKTVSKWLTQDQHMTWVFLSTVSADYPSHKPSRNTLCKRRYERGMADASIYSNPKLIIRASYVNRAVELIEVASTTSDVFDIKSINSIVPNNKDCHLDD
jgi:hypothetical protein